MGIRTPHRDLCFEQGFNKSVTETPYEIWKGKKPNLSFLKIWGCEAYAKRVDNNKPKPKSMRCLFVGYPKETNGYYFYHPQEQKVFVAKHAVFLEKEFLNVVVSGRNVKLDEILGKPQPNIPLDGTRER